MTNTFLRVPYFATRLDRLRNDNRSSSSVLDSQHIQENWDVDVRSITYEATLSEILREFLHGNRAYMYNIG